MLRILRSGRGGPERIARIISELHGDGRTVTVTDVLDGLERAIDPLPTDADVAAESEALARRGGALVAVDEPAYPRRLRDAWPELGAPPWLVVRGTVPDAPAIAVVGTRTPTADGLATARDLAKAAVRRGVAVVSGMARGIDQAAHRAALDAGGKTVAVLGTGLGVDYPRGTDAIREDIAGSGALVTELACSAPPRPPHFLARNRIVAGLSDAVVVVEGAARSGALHTARMAAGQGRDVWAAPGSIRASMSQGPLALIRDGALVLTRPEDPLDQLGAGMLDGGDTSAMDGAPAPCVAGLTVEARTVLDLLGPVPVAPAALIRESGLDVTGVLAVLAELVDAGLADHGPRGVVRRPR